ncbi:ATP-binding cassette domain-containing protein [Granulosicoccaceae sp. 1_MG-2023]|nr:ATP-binding cassette domain-containing protein [Granulosicoccaceae sp. 1_MG-2023]
MSTDLIKADQLTVIRNRRRILDNVSLRIGERDFVTIIGPNGAGKSMLLKCILGLYKPDAGEIHRRKGLRTAYVPQELNAAATMPLTVRRFLSLRMQIKRDKLNSVAEQYGIAEVLDKPLQILSGGERQRVLMTRALLKEPDLLVLDEPAQNLDISGQLAFYRLVENIYRERQLSILMVSHDLHLVMASTQQVICLYHHVCCTGTPHVVSQDPEFVSLFGKDLADMMATYRHSHDHQHGPVDHITGHLHHGHD